MNKIENSDFKRLIGTWETSGQVHAANGTVNLSGLDSYEFILGGNYILHKADVMIGNEKSETFEIISLNKKTGDAQMQYFNSKGESGVMTSEINGNEFQIIGDGIKFMGAINSENTELTGQWLIQKENKNWTEFIILKLEKRN